VEPNGTKTAAPVSPSPSQTSEPKLVFVSNSNADWWNAVEKGMHDGGADLGCDVQLRRNNGEAQGQIDRLREVLAMPDVQGVAVSVIEADAPGVIDAMRELQKAGKIVIAIDSDVISDSADCRSAYIGTVNFKAGEEAGKAAALLRPTGGKTAVFVGIAAAANAREREQGFFAGAGSPFVKTQTWEDGGDHPTARSNVQTALVKTPDVEVLLGLWSYNAPAIAEEMRAAPEVRKRMSVVTFDLDEQAVEQLEQGLIDASVCQNPYEMGYQGVKLLKALIQKDDTAVSEILPDGKMRDTGVRIVVPKADSPVKALGPHVITVEEMKAWLSSKGLKST
jgi:ribose transport system substrate-binding protein